MVLDGCPAGLALDTARIQYDLDRRRPGQSALTTDRQESDQVQVLSGLFDGLTTGTPLTLLIRNRDARPGDYDPLRELYRPSHADYTWTKKFGHRDPRGGGRSSARETAARVAAGAVARQILGGLGVRIQAWVCQVGPLCMPYLEGPFPEALIEASPTRCPDAATAAQIAEHLKELKAEGDSTGGVIRCRIDGCPPGWGEPVFDKLHADLGKAMLSINACKGFDIGSGFEGAVLRGSEHNDPFVHERDAIRTSGNRSGGIQGGISNGMPILFRAAFKPVATIRKEQTTVDQQGEAVTFSGTGRHDPCVVPRAVPIVEAMAALVLCDHFLRQKTARL